MNYNDLRKLRWWADYQTAHLLKTSDDKTAVKDWHERFVRILEDEMSKM
jgi:hypothetical protein